MKSLLFLSFLFIFSACGEKSNDSSNVTENPIDMTKFISIWKTTTPNETITLPLREGYIYNFKVDWGDSTESEVTSFDDEDITHSYAEVGNHTVTISGTAEAWYFNNSPDATKIIEVLSFGDLGWKNLELAFYGCEQLISFNGGITSNVTNMSGMFLNAYKLSKINLSTFDTTNVTDMAAMFSNASSMTSLDLSSFNTANVTNMANMFGQASSLKSLNLSNFDTTNVTDMGNMFAGTTALTTLSISSFNTSNVTNMTAMFAMASSLTSLNLSNFNTEKVLYMGSLFESTTALKTIDLSNFNTANVKEMQQMFASSGVTSLNLSNFNTSNVTTMMGIFAGTSDLTTLNTSNWDLTKASGSLYVFESANPSLVVTCNQGGSPGTGTFFGKNCN